MSAPNVFGDIFVKSLVEKGVPELGEGAGFLEISPGNIGVEHPSVGTRDFLMAIDCQSSIPPSPSPEVPALLPICHDLLIDFKF